GDGPRGGPVSRRLGSGPREVVGPSSPGAHPAATARAGLSNGEGAATRPAALAGSAPRGGPGHVGRDQRGGLARGRHDGRGEVVAWGEVVAADRVDDDPRGEEAERGGEPERVGDPERVCRRAAQARERL